MTLLGTWTVHFFPDAALNGNGANIRLPAQKIDGTIVKPGDRFSFVTAVEPVNCPPYGKGGALVHGRIVEGKVCGGGMCSTSTTLFNAAVRAGLAIVERHNHALYISRYPVGLDATVWDQGAGDGENMIFINDTGHPIEIKGYGLRRKVVFEIWGTDDGRTTSFSDPVITNQKPAAMYMEYTDALPGGQMQKEWDNYDGFDAAVTRTVKDANGNVIHLDTFHSHYSLLNGLTMVGRYPGDPQAGTLILASDYPGKPPKPTPSPSPSKSPSPPPSVTPPPPSTPPTAPPPPPARRPPRRNFPVGGADRLAALGGSDGGQREAGAGNDDRHGHPGAVQRPRLGAACEEADGHQRGAHPEEAPGKDRADGQAGGDVAVAERDHDAGRDKQDGGHDQAVAQAARHDAPIDHVEHDCRRPQDHSGAVGDYLDGGHVEAEHRQ